MKARLLSVAAVLLMVIFVIVAAKETTNETPENLPHITLPKLSCVQRTVAYKPLVTVTQSNRWGIELTDEEIDMLAEIMYLESHTESDESMIASIEVIFNRMVHEQFPNTLEEVLSQTNPVQFTTWKNRHLAEPTDKEYRLINAVLYGETEVLAKEYVYFGRSKQNNNDPILIDNHWFCKC